MKYLITVSLLFLLQISFSQLNCKTLKGLKGDSVICFHQSGAISTITSASSDYERYWNFAAFDQKGNKVYSSDYGMRHGSSSVNVKYYPNGAVSSVQRTFQPDGGIQYYDVTTYFKEDGTYDHEEDNSWDFRHDRLQIEPKEPQDLKIKTEAVIVKQDTLYFLIKNLTSTKVELLIGRKGSKNPKKSYKLSKGKELNVDWYFAQKKVIDPLEYFEIEILPKKRNKLVKPVYTKLNQGNKQFVYLIEEPN